MAVAAIRGTTRRSSSAATASSFYGRSSTPAIRTVLT